MAEQFLLLGSGAAHGRQIFARIASRRQLLRQQFQIPTQGGERAAQIMHEDLLQLLLRPPTRAVPFRQGRPQYPTKQMGGVLASVRRHVAFRIIEAQFAEAFFASTQRINESAGGLRRWQ